MLISQLARARVAGEDTLVDLDIADGLVEAVRPSADVDVSDRSGVVDVAGRVVIAGLVDAHVHLDKAYMNSILAGGGEGAADLPGAIAAVELLRPRLDASQVRAGAERAALSLVRHGIVAARAHVEIGPEDPVSLVELHLELCETMRSSLALQFCAFPQYGLASAAVRDRWMSAMDAGLDVVGGCPYTDDDAERHLDLVFALAERHTAPIDLHLDFSEEPDRSQLGLVIERTLAHSMQGKVTVGHCTSLAFLEPDAQARAFDAMADTGISLVTLPATDLYLVGHGEPGSRSLAPVERARAAGVCTAIANNNIANPFAPFGNANLLQAAWLAGVIRHLRTVAERDGLLDAITHAPATILGLPSHGPRVGAVADFAILDTQDPHDVVAQSPAVVATVTAGRLVHHLSGFD